MTCNRCGASYSKPTAVMKRYDLCIHCVMEWHRKGNGKSLAEFSQEKRESHFKM